MQVSYPQNISVVYFNTRLEDKIVNGIQDIINNLEQICCRKIYLLQNLNLLNSYPKFVSRKIKIIIVKSNRFFTESRIYEKVHVILVFI